MILELDFMFNYNYLMQNGKGSNLIPKPIAPPFFSFN
jgi:hypothetical protein